LFFFNIYNSKCCYDLNLSRKFHFTTMHKMAMFFLSWDSYLQGQKKSLFHIWSYHLNYRSQWPWFKTRHIVFLRYTYLPNLMILEQVVFSLRVGQDFSLFCQLSSYSKVTVTRFQSATHRLPELYQLTKFDDSRYNSI
jgi:hypothetical protein